MLILAVAAVIVLFVGLCLRFLADPRPVEMVNDLRQFALIFGMGSFLVAGRATTTTAAQLPAFGRRLTLWVLPRLDEAPPPVTPAAER